MHAELDVYIPQSEIQNYFVFFFKILKLFFKSKEFKKWIARINAASIFNFEFFLKL